MLRSPVKLAIILGLAFFPPLASSQDDLLQKQHAKPEQIQVKRLSVPLDAVKLALLDVANFTDDAAFFRYVWVPGNEKDHCDAVDFSVNVAMSRASTLVKGVRIGENRLIRYDLRVLAPDEEDIKEIGELWEKFAEDESYFLVNSETDQLGFDETKIVIIVKEGSEIVNTKDTLERPKVDSEWKWLDDFKDDNGEWYVIEYNGEKAYVAKSFCKLETRKTKKAGGEEKKQVRVLGPHLGKEAPILIEATLSQVPIVRHDYFIRKILSTVEGGLYYEFRGIVASPNDNQTDLEFLLLDKFKVKIEDFVNSNNDQKVAMMRSKVTGKPRATLFIAGARRVTANQGLIVLTLDLDEDEAVEFNDPFLDILNHKYQGIELFAELGNGMTLYALYTGDLNGNGKFEKDNGEGVLVREVPPQIATDHKVPAPHSNRLQPAISCMRCHNQIVDGKQQEGWIDHPNDVIKLVGAGLDIFGQRNDKQPKFETINRKAGLYTGDFDKVFRRARDDYAEAILRLNGNPGTEEQSTVTLAVDQIVQIYHAYWFDLVTPKKACEELGFGVETDEQAVQWLNEILPVLPSDELGIHPEDVRLGALKAGLSINRFQWDAVFADASNRTIETLQSKFNEQKQPVKADKGKEI